MRPARIKIRRMVSTFLETHRVPTVNDAPMGRLVSSICDRKNGPYSEARRLIRAPPLAWPSHSAIPAVLFPCWRMCYNRRAVERAAKQGLSSAGLQQGTAPSPEATPQLDRSSVAKKTNFSAVAESVDRLAMAPQEDCLAVAQSE